MNNFRDRVNATASFNYMTEGPGVGAGAGALEWLEANTTFRVSKDSSVLEVGFGAGEFLMACAKRGADAYGVDICRACADHAKVEHEAMYRTEYFAAQKKGQIKSTEVPFTFDILDVSHDQIESGDNSRNIVVCTETIEHVANPLFMLADVKRILIHGGLLVLAFPMPESNEGTGPGKHMHVLPGLLYRPHFEKFMRQMYFKQIARTENGDSAWYAFLNYKGEGVIDPFAVCSGNYDEQQLYGMLDTWNGVY